MTYLVPLHGIGTRRDLPLPFSYVVGGAGTALVLVLSLVLGPVVWMGVRRAFGLPVLWRTERRRVTEAYSR